MIKAQDYFLHLSFHGQHLTTQQINVLKLLLHVLEFFVETLINTRSLSLLVLSPCAVTQTPLPRTHTHTHIRPSQPADD